MRTWQIVVLATGVLIAGSYFLPDPDREIAKEVGANPPSLKTIAEVLGQGLRFSEVVSLTAILDLSGETSGVDWFADFLSENDTEGVRAARFIFLDPGVFPERRYWSVDFKGCAPRLCADMMDALSLVPADEETFIDYSPRVSRFESVKLSEQTVRGLAYETWA